MNYVKVIFKLNIEDDWPPVSFETLNCIKISGTEAVVSNTPFFAESVANGDTIEVSESSDGEIYFEKVTKFSGSSAISIIIIQPSIKDGLIGYLEEIGCTVESGDIQGYQMLAVEVPPSVSMEPLGFYLNALEFEKNITFDVLCHA